MTEIPADMSCTEVSQIWHKPRGDKIEPEPVMKLTFAKTATDRQLRKREPGVQKKSKGTSAPSKEEVATIQEIVGARNSNIPIVYLTKDHSTTHSTDTLFGEVPTGSPLSYQLQDYHSSKSEFSAYIPSKVDIVLQDNLRFPDIPVPNSSLNIDLTQLDETSKTFLQSLDVTKARSEEIEQITIDQSQNKLWHEMRKNRLTASKFGDVINRKSEPSEAFVKNLLTCKDLSSVKSISHGRDKEDTARKLYTKKMKNNCKHNVSVFRTGLLINPSCPYLGASPDGKVLDRSSYDHFGLLEIKCPYKYRNTTPAEAARNTDFCLEIMDEELHLKRSHSYFYQVTGQMAVAGVNWCDFVVFMNKGLFVERIFYDKNVWARIFPKLAQFYVNSAVPYLKNKQTDV